MHSAGFIFACSGSRHHSEKLHTRKVTDNRKNNEFVFVVVVVLEEKKTGGEGSGKSIPSPTFMGPGPNPDLTPINAGAGGG